VSGAARLAVSALFVLGVVWLWHVPTVGLEFADSRVPMLLPAIGTAFTAPFVLTELVAFAVPAWREARLHPRLRWRMNLVSAVLGLSLVLLQSVAMMRVMHDEGEPLAPVLVAQWIGLPLLVLALVPVVSRLGIADGLTLLVFAAAADHIFQANRALFERGDFAGLAVFFVVQAVGVRLGLGLLARPAPTADTSAPTAPFPLVPTTLGGTGVAAVSNLSKWVPLLGDHAVSTLVGGLVGLDLSLLFAALTWRPSTVARAWARRLPHLDATALQLTVRDRLVMDLRRTVALVVLLPLTPVLLFALMASPPLDGPMVLNWLIATWVLSDVLEELRARQATGTWVVAGQLHRLCDVEPAQVALVRAGIPHFVRGVRFRATSHFLVPWAAMDVYVAPEHAARAAEVLA